jgi:hypothetical protein
MSYNVEFSVKYSLLLITNIVLEFMSWDFEGNIPKIKKNSLQYSLLLAPIMILSIFFCDLQTSTLCEEFPRNNSPLVINEWK